MSSKYIFKKLPLLKNAKGNIFFKTQRTFNQVKNNIEIRYIKEGKTKYIVYTIISSLACSLLLTYAHERYILYKWNYKYDYYYSPHLKNERHEKKEKKIETNIETNIGLSNATSNSNITTGEGMELKDTTNNSFNNNINVNEKGKGKEKEKVVVKNIILVRHGQYERRFKDEESKYLTTEGSKQAEITGKKLKDILKNKKINVIYHSNIIRAKETAQIISKYFPDAKLINDPNLNEGTPYLPDPLPKNSKFEVQKIKADNKRINKAYETYFYRPKDDEDDSYQLIICHGNVIRYFLCRALQIPLFAWLRFSSYNCGITWLVLDNEGSVVLREFGSVSHLPFESVTYF